MRSASSQRTAAPNGAIPAWSRNVSSPAPTTPKLAFVDSGIAAHQIGAGTEAQIFHYRTTDQVEVGAVLENRRGDVVGIEIKAASTVGPNGGLRHLAQRIADDFRAGIVMHTGTQTLPFGPTLLAVPICALWPTPPHHRVELRGDHNCRPDRQKRPRP